MEGSIGILSSRLTLEDPIGDGKTPFIISGRRSYIDLIAKLADQRTSQEKGVEGDFDFIPSPNHHIRFGLGNIYHTYNLGTLAVAFNLTGQASKRINNQKEYYTHEYFSYVEDNWKLGKLAANIGLHVSMFSKETKSYSPFQPRLGLRYLFDKKWSVKASYSQMTQYIHLLSSESIGIPTDMGTFNERNQTSNLMAECSRCCDNIK